MIPVAHAGNAALLAPAARVSVIQDAGHFPHKNDPDGFVRILAGFIATTEPARYSRARFRRLLKAGPSSAPVASVQTLRADATA